MPVPSSRRQFLKSIGLASGVLAITPASIGTAFGQHTTAPSQKQDNVIRFGVIADVHQDYQPDAQRRLRDFITAASLEKPDFIIQLGDLSHGKGMDKILPIWNEYQGDKYHVLGGHEMDFLTKDEVVKKQQMPGNYYSFDHGDYHFVVMDLNYILEDGKCIDFSKGNYFKCKYHEREVIHPEQLEWLKKDLEATEKPTIIFSHAGLDESWNQGGSPSRHEVRKIIFEANQQAYPKKKVIACFCGHNHVDEYAAIQGVHYFQINSASYWIGSVKGKLSRGSIAEYKDSLYAIVTLNPAESTITIDGVQSEFIPPTPTREHTLNANLLFPEIKDRKVSY